jgi:ATP-dependent DNA helicase RecG
MNFFDGLTRPVTVLKGIGEHHELRITSYMAKHVKRLGRAEIRDLLCHVPFDYIDRRDIVDLVQAGEGQRTLLVRAIQHYAPAKHKHKGKTTPYKIQCEDDTASMMLMFFHGDTRYLVQQFPINQPRIISGTLQHYDGMWQMTHPDIVAHPDKKSEVCRLDAIYHATEGISSKMFSRWIGLALAQLPDTHEEWLLASTMQHYAWPSFAQALRTIHRPDDVTQREVSRTRLAYDEALAHQLSMQLLRASQQRTAGLRLQCMQHDTVKQCIVSLPFALTEGQKHVLHDISEDMISGQRMLRLLQGDVGAGKTIIAFIAMMSAHVQGYQSALMVPTEILAKQHYEALLKCFPASKDDIIFLAGSLTEAQKRRTRDTISTHHAALIIGTHALFQDMVNFNQLGLVVVDEQHRFGVQQRMKLTEKGLNPHLLLMTATPIPRSLALAQYGDMDVSVLKEKPKGRQNIDTRALPLSRMEEILAATSRALAAGEKLYWICPLVEENTDNPDMQWQAAEARYASLQILFGANVGLMHGKMDMSERSAVMQQFKDSTIQILVATTVVEVGVDVPDATIMIIENAERFGLAQLHQLRGRVGRGAKASRCLLLYGDNASYVAKKRLNIMRDTNDGFVISEEDLRLRGAGEMLGTRQTGLPHYIFLQPETDSALMRSAKKEAQIVLKTDPTLASDKGAQLRSLMQFFEVRDAEKRISSG